VAYSSEGEYDEAISDFNKAVKTTPNFAVPFYNRARCYYFKKEYDKAWDDSKRAQDLGFKVPPEFFDDLRKASGREK
jgi:tetratricopeptide (TPR) repeat protein